MADINPSIDPDGVPVCSQTYCGQFDGKRCRATGEDVETTCVPAVRELVADRNRLGQTLARVERRLMVFNEVNRG